MLNRQRGFCAIGVYAPKTPDNVGCLWRSSLNFGASYIFTIGHRYRRQPSDTPDTARSIPLYEFADFAAFHAHVPQHARIVAVEQADGAKNICSFVHPEQAIYLLGAEDRGLPADVAAECDIMVQIPTIRCLNVAVAGSIILYDRAAKGERFDPVV